MDDRTLTGYTLVDLVVTLAVLTLLIGWAVPAFTDFIDRQRLRAAALHIAADLRLARNESLYRHGHQPVGVSFTPGARWCYGISQQLPCDCRQADWRAADACVLDATRSRQLRRATHARFPHITLQRARFSGGAETRFEPLRGLARAGAVELQSTRGQQIEIRVSTLGRVRVCTARDQPRLAGISPC